MTNNPAIECDALEAALSLERFGRYVAWADGNRSHALSLYALNTRLSEALYVPLQMLEVVLRNRIHAILAEARQPRWFEQSGFLVIPHQITQVAEAIATLTRQDRDPTPGRVVAALTFSFWNTMLSPSYENLWQTDLHRVGRREDGKGLRRKELSGPLTPIRLLRNRIAHHEPILAWNLSQHHAAMLRIIAWLSPAAGVWSADLDRFGAVFPPERIRLHAA
jgi:hypothetical protein